MNLNQITRYTVFFLTAMVVITVSLRIILSVFYQGQLTAIKFSKKDRKSPLLNKIINDYKIASEKGIANVNTKQIVMKHMRKFNFIGWSLDSIDSFVRKVETQAGFIGIATVFLPDTDKLWCAGATAAMLVLFWLLGSIFDYECTKAKLEIDLIDHVDNVEGIFYSKDLGSAILSLKNELQSAMLNTNKVLSDAIYKMNTGINDGMKYGTDNIVRTMQTSMNALVNYANVLKEPMQSWKENIEQASNLQKDLNSTSQDLKEAMTKFQEIYSQLDKQLQTGSTDMKEVNIQMRKQIEQLFTVVYNIDENSKTVNIHNEALQKQLKYVDDNQEVLNITLQKYQGTIEEFTANIGEVFSNIVTIYSRNATSSIVSGMENFSSKLIEVNKDILGNINESIDELSRQNRVQQQSVLDIKKQLEYRLDDENISRG